MPPSKRWTDVLGHVATAPRGVATALRRVAKAEHGSASLEFITAGMLLLVPMVYLVLTLSALQAGSFAVEGAARQAARVFVEADDIATAVGQSRRAVEFALADHGLADGDATVDISCTPQPDACLTRQGIVTVTVGASVALPLVPPGLAVDIPLSVPLQAAASQQVSRFWGSR